MIEAPKWINPPRAGWIRLSGTSDNHPLMLAVEKMGIFSVNGEEYTVIVPEHLIDVANSRIRVSVVAKCGSDEDLLVDLPGDTYPNGPRILVPASEERKLLVYDDQ